MLVWHFLGTCVLSVEPTSSSPMRNHSYTPPYQESTVQCRIKILTHMCALSRIMCNIEKMFYEKMQVRFILEHLRQEILDQWIYVRLQ